MKTTILKLTLSTLIIGTQLVSCNSSAEKVQDAKENVVEANQDLEKANQILIDKLNEDKILDKTNFELIFDSSKYNSIIEPIFSYSVYY